MPTTRRTEITLPAKKLFRDGNNKLQIKRKIYKVKDENCVQQFAARYIIHIRKLCPAGKYLRLFREI